MSDVRARGPRGGLALALLLAAAISAGGTWAQTDEEEPITTDSRPEPAREDIREAQSLEAEPVRPTRTDKPGQVTEQEQREPLPTDERPERPTDSTLKPADPARVEQRPQERPDATPVETPIEKPKERPEEKPTEQPVDAIEPRPVEEEAAEEKPVEEEPVEEEPVDEEPAKEEPLVEEPPVEDPPVEKPAEEPEEPTEEQPVDRPDEAEPETEQEPEEDETEAPATETDTPTETQEPARPRQPERQRTRPRVDRGGSLMNAGPATLPPTPPAPSSPPADDSTADPAAPDDDIEPGELVLVSEDMPAAMAAAGELAGYQLRVKSRQTLGELGLVVSVFRLPPDADTRTLITQIRSQQPHLNLDANQRYRLMSDARKRYGQTSLGWHPQATLCLSDANVGLLDTAVAEDHPALAERPINQKQFVRAKPAAADHGTAIASLWLGQADAGFAPLLPEANLSVAAIFRQRGEQTETTTDILVSALDWLLGEEVEAINLSLGGQDNRIVALVLEQLLERDILLVAAAGNQGPDQPPLYPAAQAGVLSATAVDADRRIYAHANRGDRIDFAAPGVQLWAANQDSAGYQTGTSYAAPLVLATLLAEKRAGGAWLERAQQASLDLGEPGKDDTFGWGLIQWPEDCQ